MSETPSLRQRITETINEYLAQNGGGIPNGFIYSIGYINGDGINTVEIGAMDSQSPMLSAGLLAYLNTVIDEAVAGAVLGACDCGCDDEDEDD